MKSYIGLVKGIFIPDEDVMNSKNIGFNVLINDKIYQFIITQNEKNSMILREDKVKVIIKNMNLKQYIEIEKCEDYE